MRLAIAAEPGARTLIQDDAKGDEPEEGLVPFPEEEQHL